VIEVEEESNNHDRTERSTIYDVDLENTTIDCRVRHRIQYHFMILRI
jgi:hypothetical protein